MEIDPTDQQEQAIVLDAELDAGDAAQSPTIDIDRKEPMPVGSRAEQILGSEYIAEQARLRRLNVERHRQLPQVKAARLATQRSMRLWLG